MKLAKFFVVWFCWLFWELTLHKTWKNTKGGYVCSNNQPINVLRVCNSCIANERKTKDVQGQGPSNINLSLFVFLRSTGFLTIPFINYHLTN